MVAVSDWPKGSPLNGHEHQLPFLLFEEVKSVNSLVIIHTHKIMFYVRIILSTFFYDFNGVRSLSEIFLRTRWLRGRKYMSRARNLNRL